MGENVPEADTKPVASPANTERSGIRNISRRRAIGAIAGAVASATILPEIAQAQGLFDPGFDPVPVPPAKPSGEAQIMPAKPVIVPGQIGILREAEAPLNKDLREDLTRLAEKDTNTASQFLNNHEKIKLDIEKGETTHVHAKYNPPVSDTTDPRLYVRYSEKDKKPLEYTYLEIDEKLAEIMRENKGDYLTERITKYMSAITGIRLKELKWENVAGEDRAKLEKIKKCFDFAEYTDGVNRDIPGGTKTIAEELSDKIMALWMREPKKLEEKIRSIGDDPLQTVVAGIAGRVVQVMLTGVGASTKWSSLGLDETSIFKVIELSKDSELNRDFDKVQAALK